MADLIPWYIVRSLLLTVILETGLAFLLGIRKKQDVLIVVLSQIATNPIVNVTALAVNLFISYEARNIAVVFLELFAFVSEAVIYKYTLDYKKINPFVLSLILNGFSFTSGLIINHIFR